MEPNRDEAGNYTETVTLNAVLGVFESINGPVVTSADVAEALGCSRETARRKLRTLEDQGRVAGRKTAGRVVWWLTPSEETVEEIDPDDPLFTGVPLLAPEDPVDETEIDDVLYSEG